VGQVPDLPWHFFTPSQALQQKPVLAKTGKPPGNAGVLPRETIPARLVQNWNGRVKALASKLVRQNVHDIMTALEMML